MSIDSSLNYYLLTRYPISDTMSSRCEARVWDNDASDYAVEPHGVTAKYTVTDAGVTRHVCKMHQRLHQRSENRSGTYGCRYAAKRGGFHGFMGEDTECILLNKNDVRIGNSSGGGKYWYRGGWHHERVGEEIVVRVPDDDSDEQEAGTDVTLIKVRRWKN